MAKNTGAKTGIALAGLAAAAAAGYYFYASKDAQKHRRVAAAWAHDLKSEVVSQAKKVQNINRAQMLSIIDGVADAYRSAKDIDRKELLRAAKELKDNWQRIAQEVGVRVPAKKRAKKRSKKA